MLHQICFHTDDFLVSVSVVGDMNEVFELGRVDLFVLAGHKQSCDA